MIVKLTKSFLCSVWNTLEALKEAVAVEVKWEVTRSDCLWLCQGLL